MISPVVGREFERQRQQHRENGGRIAQSGKDSHDRAEGDADQHPHQVHRGQGRAEPIDQAFQCIQRNPGHPAPDLLGGRSLPGRGDQREQRPGGQRDGESVGEQQVGRDRDQHGGDQAPQITATLDPVEDHQHQQHHRGHVADDGDQRRDHAEGDQNGHRRGASAAAAGLRRHVPSVLAGSGLRLAQRHAGQHQPERDEQTGQDLREEPGSRHAVLAEHRQVSGVPERRRADRGSHTAGVEVHASHLRTHHHP